MTYYIMMKYIYRIYICKSQADMVLQYILYGNICSSVVLYDKVLKFKALYDILWRDCRPL